MNTITLGLFHDYEKAEDTINELGRHGSSSKDISIAMNGGILLGVPTTNNSEEMVKKILKDHGAVQIRTVNKEREEI